MKTDSKIALGALAVGAAAFLLARKHTKGASGIGAVRAMAKMGYELSDNDLNKI